MQNQYDCGWYDGIEYGLTMKNVRDGYYPDNGQAVLLFLEQSKMFISANYIDDGYQKYFITPDNKQFYIGYVNWWLPHPTFPNNNTN